MTFPAHCQVPRCTRPAAYAIAGDARCEHCAPDGCQICWAFDRRCCKQHQAPRPLMGPEERPPANRNGYRPELKLLCGEHPAFTGLSETHHPMHDVVGSEDDTLVLEALADEVVA